MGLKLYRVYQNEVNSLKNDSKIKPIKYWINILYQLDNYIILDGIEGCMRIYCTRHDDIHRAGTAR